LEHFLSFEVALDEGPIGRLNNFLTLFEKSLFHLHQLTSLKHNFSVVYLDGRKIETAILKLGDGIDAQEAIFALSLCSEYI
jgi:hypothetical protein